MLINWSEQGPRLRFVLTSSVIGTSTVRFTELILFVSAIILLYTKHNRLHYLARTHYYSKISRSGHWHFLTNLLRWAGSHLIYSWCRMSLVEPGCSSRVNSHPPAKQLEILIAVKMSKEEWKHTGLVRSMLAPITPWLPLHTGGFYWSQGKIQFEGREITPVFGITLKTQCTQCGIRRKGIVDWSVLTLAFSQRAIINSSCQRRPKKTS